MYTLLKVMKQREVKFKYGYTNSLLTKVLQLQTDTLNNIYMYAIENSQTVNYRLD